MVSGILWELRFPGCYYWNAAAAFLTVGGLEALSHGTG